MLLRDSPLLRRPAPGGGSGPPAGPGPGLDDLALELGHRPVGAPEVDLGHRGDGDYDLGQNLECECTGCPRDHGDHRRGDRDRDDDRDGSHAWCVLVEGLRASVCLFLGCTPVGSQWAVGGAEEILLRKCPRITKDVFI